MKGKTKARYKTQQKQKLNKDKDEAKTETKTKTKTKTKLIDNKRFSKRKMKRRLEKPQIIVKLKVEFSHRYTLFFKINKASLKKACTVLNQR
jgi:hypothetical protein